VEELAVGPGTDLVDGRRVEVHENGTGNMLAAARLGEERLERARVADILGVGVGAAIGAEAMLEQVAITTTVSVCGARGCGW